MLWRRNIIVFVCFFICGSVTLGCAQGKAYPRNASSQEGSSDRSWDFGTVKNGQILKHDFVLKNNSDRIVAIKSVSTSCGCTVSEVKKKILSPGEETVLAVIFKSAGYQGTVQQSVYVATDRAGASIERFVIKAHVVEK